MGKIIINGILANEEDLKTLNYFILEKNIDFTVRKDCFGNQYIITFN